MNAPKPPRNRQTKDYVFFLTSEFSQWFPSEFVDESGRVFHCCEQYMMFHKALAFGDTATADKVMQATTPAECKQLGREVANFEFSHWETIARDIVYRANEFKFTQNPLLWDVMAQTKGKKLVEAAHYDKVWGIGLAASDTRSNDPAQWQGKNWLGETLTKLRDDLLKRGFEPERTPEKMRQFKFYDGEGQRNIYITQAELCAQLGVKTSYEAVQWLDSFHVRDGELHEIHFEKLGKIMSVTVNDLRGNNRELCSLIVLEKEEPATVEMVRRNDPFFIKKFGK